MKASIYQRFYSLLQTGSYTSYEGICRSLRVCPDDLDELLLNELGYTGMQVFECYFGNRSKNY